jgi:Zn-dependent metalloprotease
MCKKCRHPRNCIIPPYLSKRIEIARKIQGLDTNIESTMAEKRFRSKRKNLAMIDAPKRKTMMFTHDTVPTNKPHLQVYDAEQLPITPGSLKWETGQAKPAEKDFLRAIDGAEKTWEFYFKLFNRRSIDNKGMMIIESLHYREDPRKLFDNAFWDGEMMLFGEGDGLITTDFTSDIDIIAHELSHGVIDFEIALVYKKDSGALNESFADVFGMLVKQWDKKTAARKSNWLLGENVLVGDKYALRSMKAPGKAFVNHPDLGDDPQPATMDDYVDTIEDDGGVHINSGIPNHAFYVAAWEMAGNAWEKAGKIWYAAATDKKLMKKHADFHDCREATLNKAAGLFGKNSLAYKAVKKGWDEVKVD